MLPETPWYIDGAIAIFCLILALLGAYWTSLRIPGLGAIGGLLWVAALVVGSNATWNYTMDVPIYPWHWLSAGFAIFLFFGPFAAAMERENSDY